MTKPDLRGPWSRQEIDTFLDEQISPLRLAFHAAGGYPHIVSLWYLRDGGSLWCAVPDSSFTARALSDDPRCGLEVAVNRPPYRGVRGVAEATLNEQRGPFVLRSLIARYLGDDSSDLARWLLSRQDSELAVRLDPLQLSTWDYTNRMEPIFESSKTGQ